MATAKHTVPSKDYVQIGTGPLMAISNLGDFLLATGASKPTDDDSSIVCQMNIPMSINETIAVWAKAVVKPYSVNVITSPIA